MTRPVSAPLTAPPEGMPADIWSLIGRMRPEVRLRVLERAAILIYQAGLSPREADQRALAEEAGIPFQLDLGGAR